MLYHNRNSYTGPSKKKIVIRVIIVVVSLLTVSAVTFAFGNYLKAKAEATTVAGIGAGRGEADQAGVGRDRSGEAAKVDGTKSSCVPLASVSSADDGRELVDKIAAKGYTGITVVLVDRSGYLTYTSESVAKFTRQKAANIKDPAVVSAITDQAKSHSMRTTAVIFSSSDYSTEDMVAAIDSRVVSDAVALGFDETVVMLPTDAASLDSALASSAVRYLNSLGENKGDTALGVSLSLDIYADPKLSPQVELFASVCDFLAIDLTGKQVTELLAKNAVNDALDAVSGYFTMYGLRAVFDGSEEKIAAAEVKALTDAGFSNYMFISATQFAEEADTGDSADDPDAYDPSDNYYDPPVPDEPSYTDPDPSGGGAEPTPSDTALPDDTPQDTDAAPSGTDASQDDVTPEEPPSDGGNSAPSDPAAQTDAPDGGGE